VQHWIIFGIFGFVLLCAVIGVIAANIFEKKRREALRALANELNLEFYEYGRTDLLTILSPLQLFNLGRSRYIRNLIRAEAGGIQLDIFDYRYVTGSGKHQQTSHYSVLTARADGLKLPQFSLKPASLMNKIGNWLGFRDISFDTHTKFSKLYRLEGANEPAIRDVFQPQVLEYFEEHPGLHVEGAGDLLVYFVSQRLAVAKIRDFMGDGFTMLNLFRATGSSATSQSNLQ
jgi:hypothetical protein